MNTLFKNNHVRKRRKYYISIHKAMQIPVYIYETNKKLFVIVKQKTHVNWNLQIIYCYHFLINLSETLWFLQYSIFRYIESWYKNGNME